MPVDRPTFSESWYRVATLRPRLRTTVQVYRQHFRGQLWYVLHDPTSNQSSRLSSPAYAFVGLLDGRRSISQAWQSCSEHLGDSAPTQPEAIQLLGQLYTANLLHADLPPDAEGLFKRYRQRRTREVQGYIMNILFLRIPLFDPNRFLDRWVGLFGKVFSWPGMFLWIGLIAMGLYFIWGRTDELTGQASKVLDPSRLPLLYVAAWIIKIFHEFGHAFATKRFGRLEGGNGDVNTIGVMFLVLMPLPYVDASSASTFRSKWHRVVVGAAGMMVELAIAGIAAAVWAKTGADTNVHKLAYNIMFIASVSTVLFNGNPLLRFDGYYILSDLIEIPNLAQRSKQYLYYLVRRWPWGVRRAINPAYSIGEKAWFVVYGIASTVYRVFISVRILLFIGDKLFIAGALLGAVALVGWVMVPVGRFVHYLATSGELARVRGRAVGSTFAAALLIASLIGAIGVTEHDQVQGIVEPQNVKYVFIESDGFLTSLAKPSGSAVHAGDVLVQADNPDLVAQLTGLRAERRGLQAKLLQTAKDDLATAQAIVEQISAVDQKLSRAQTDVDNLTVRAPIDGVWFAPELEHVHGAYLTRKQPLGEVAGGSGVIVRAIGSQAVDIKTTQQKVEIRVKGQPDPTVTGQVYEVYPTATQDLPSPSLSYQAGGGVQTKADDSKAQTAAEHFFEIRIRPDDQSNLVAGQRVIVRLASPATPLVVQWWHSALQLLQRRGYL